MGVSNAPGEGLEREGSQLCLVGVHDEDRPLLSIRIQSR